MRENQGKHRRTECGKPIEVLRRHFWLRIPEHPSPVLGGDAGGTEEPADGRAADGYGDCRMTGVGDTTVGRWRQSGKLPEPVKRERGTNRRDPSQDR